MAKKQPRKGFKGKGRPSTQDYKRLKKAQALLEAKNAKEAYKLLNPTCADSTAKEAGRKMVTPETVEEMRRILALNQSIKTNRDMVEKVLWSVVALWNEGAEKTPDMLKAISMLTQLLDDFQSKTKVSGSLSSATDEEVDKEFKKMLEEQGLRFNENEKKEEDNTQ